MALVKRSWTQTGFGQDHMKNEICTFWLRGKCNRNPCRFIHGDTSSSRYPQMKTKQSRNKTSGSHTLGDTKNTTRFVFRRSPDPKKVSAPQKPLESEKIIVEEDSPKATKRSRTMVDHKVSDPEKVSAPLKPLESERIIVEEDSPKATKRSRTMVDHKVSDPEKGDCHEEKSLAQKAPEPENVIVQEDCPKQCKNWVTGNCVHGDKCKDLHSWFYGSGFQMLAKLEGHSKAISGIALPYDSNMLYSMSVDNSTRVWDCNSGQCANTIDTNVELRCLVREGHWLFLGLTDGVKAWNSKSKIEFFLSSNSSVCSINTDDGKVFVGTEDGSIYVWKWDSERIDENPIAILKEHNGAVTSLISAPNGQLYSGSKDCTIKSWNRERLEFDETLYGHTGEVTGLLIYDKYLLSSSLDKTIKVWARTENKIIEVIFEMQQQDSVIALDGIHDSESKPVLLSSCSDNTVRLYDLPSFFERGRIFTNDEVRTIHTDNFKRLFFLGDSTGNICVWNML